MVATASHTGRILILAAIFAVAGIGRAQESATPDAVTEPAATEPAPAVDAIPVSPEAAATEEASGEARHRKPVQEIIVTATKRQSSLENAAAAVSVIGEEDLALRDVRSIDDMQNSVPGMQVGAVQGNPIVTVRG